MLSRRELLSAGMAGGLASGADASPAALTTQSDAVAGILRDIARGIQSLDGSFDQAWSSNSVTYGLVSKVRAQFETYFRTTQKFPDFLEVGLSVFLDIYDWHIKNRQPLVISRGPDARYWMQYMFTTIILRGEHDPNYIGIPYDKA
jgi:hypothetical protein